jgi:hypothetical protein
MKAALGVIAAVLVLTSGCARQDWIDRTLVTVDVTGVWSGSLRGAQAPRDVRLELKQEGSRVTGTMRLIPAMTPNETLSPIEGNVAGDLFTFHDPRGSLSGELTVVGEDEMTGRADGLYGIRGITLRRESSR